MSYVYPPPPPPPSGTPLDLEINKAVAEGWTLVARDDSNAVFNKGGNVRHVMHGIISLVTCGVWLWGWAIVAILGARQAMTLTMDENGYVDREGPKSRAPYLAGVAGLFVVVMIVGSLLPDDTSTTAADDLAPPESSAPVRAADEKPEKPKADEKESVPAPVVEEESEPDPAPEFTVIQEQAIRKATDYLDYTSFSRKGLIEQLKFDGFSEKEATFGVDHVTVNWMKQAEKKAQDYLDYTSFSREGLITQLEFDGFTHKQAVHGADSVGL